MNKYIIFECDLPNEVWKPVIGYEGLYEVSNLGRIKSLPKTHGGYRCCRSLLISQRQNRLGYLSVVLYKNKIRSYPTAHRLVAKAFIPNPHNLPMVNHKNGIKTDNNIDNLEWCTAKENVNHSWAKGLSSYKPKIRIFKLHDDEVDKIRELYKTGNFSYFKLAEIFGVSFGTIGKIVRNERRTNKYGDLSHIINA